MLISPSADPTGNESGQRLARDQLVHPAVCDHCLLGTIGLCHAVDQLPPSPFAHRSFVDEPAHGIPQRPVPEALMRALQIMRMVCVNVNELETGFTCPGMRPAPTGVVHAAG